MKQQTPKQGQYLCPKLVTCAISLERGFANSTETPAYDGFIGYEASDFLWAKRERNPYGRYATGWYYSCQGCSVRCLKEEQ